MRGVRVQSLDYFTLLIALRSGSGWGNILQEMFLNTYLAYSAKRSCVNSYPLRVNADRSYLVS